MRIVIKQECKGSPTPSLVKTYNAGTEFDVVPDNQPTSEDDQIPEALATVFLAEGWATEAGQPVTGDTGEGGEASSEGAGGESTNSENSQPEGADAATDGQSEGAADGAEDAANGVEEAAKNQPEEHVESVIPKKKRR